MSNYLDKLPPVFRTKLSFQIASGTIEALKWLALISMTFDHVNKSILHASIPMMTSFGRLAMPIFGFVLAYNLAREPVYKKAFYDKLMLRMLIVGLIATPLYMLALHPDRFFPLNIMFTLMLSTALIALIQQKNRVLTAIFLFIYASLLVDYAWFGVLYCIAAWMFCRQKELGWFLLWVLATAALYFANGNYWGMMVIPLIYVASKVDVHMPRLRYIFYAYYPLHLLVLAVLVGLKV